MLAVALAQSEQTDRAIFRSATRAVQLDVFVGNDGSAVVGLQAEDFAVYDDDVPREVHFVAESDAPLNVALIVDVSQSVAGERLEHLKSAASGFVSALDDRDRAAILSFSQHLSLNQELTPDADRLLEAIESLRSYGATAWHDALFAGLEIMEPVTSRPLILLFTDGEDTYSWLSADDLVAVVEQSAAVIYAIGRREHRRPVDLSANDVNRRRSRQRSRRVDARRTRLLRTLTRASGGRFVETESAEELRPLFLQLLAEMKTRYVLTFQLPRDASPGWHELRVEVKNHGRVDVRAKRGYFYEPQR